MSGLFLNFYLVNFEGLGNITVAYKNRSDFTIKELKEQYKNCSFYAYEDKILFWNKNGEIIPEVEQITINLNENYKVLSKIFLDAILELFEKEGYTIKKQKYSHIWQFISNKNLLKGKINGLEVYRTVNFSPYFFVKNQNKFFGFTLTTKLKHKFTWNKQEFINNGIDINGLKGNGERIFANTQSIKRFLVATGQKDQYEEILNPQKTNALSFKIINGVYKWILKHKNEIPLPFNLKIKNIQRFYLPFGDEQIKPTFLKKPERYFYSNRTNAKRLKFYDEMVKEYRPFSFEQFQNQQIKIGVICPREYQGETEVFIKRIENKLKEDFHIHNIKLEFNTIPDRKLESYKRVLYDTNLQKSDLIFIVVDEEHEKLSPGQSPYYVCKAKFIGNGIPTQDIKIEKIRNYKNFILNNLSLNVYAKLGGTAWTIEQDDKLKRELIIGIGSAISDDGKRILGIAQIFNYDGKYITGDCTTLSSFENYAENLEKVLFQTLSPFVKEINNSSKLRLIFHLFKPASKKYELKAIDNLLKHFENYDIEFALVHLGYGHNFRLYYNDGKYKINSGTYLQLDKRTALLHFVSESDLPLKIEIDRRSTFTSLYYIAKQVYWLSHLSNRSYIPSKKPITLTYSALMAQMTEQLKNVDGWDYERLTFIKDKLWFI